MSRNNLIEVRHHTPFDRAKFKPMERLKTKVLKFKQPEADHFLFRKGFRTMPNIKFNTRVPILVSPYRPVEYTASNVNLRGHCTATSYAQD